MNRDSIYENIVPNEIKNSKKHKDTRTDLDDFLVCDEIVPEGHSNNCRQYNSQHIKPLCTYDLINWSFQVARRMEYLSSKKERLSEKKNEYNFNILPFFMRSYMVI